MGRPSWSADRLYAYMGDGGEYRYADEWLSGETVDAPSSRFACGSETLERWRMTASLLSR